MKTMEKPLFIILIFASFALSACEGKECQEPTPEPEIEERTSEMVGGWLDEMDAYDLQRERVAGLVTGLKADRLTITKKRRVTRNAVISELMKDSPDRKRLTKLVNQSKAYSMTYTWKVVDQGVAAHRMFTQKQRAQLAESLEEPPDEFSLGFVARRGIDVFMISIGASSDQKSRFSAALDGFEDDVNGLLKDQHAIRLKLTKQWRAATLDKNIVRSNVSLAADGITSFVHDQLDKGVDVLAIFDAEQRATTNDRLRRAKVCTPGQKP